MAHYDIETGFTMGLRGSGKTYDLACKVNDWFADGHVVHTINMDLNKDRIVRRLINKGRSYYDANTLVGKSEKIWTLAHFSRLRNCVIAVDEGHFWFPQNQYMKISLETILDMAMGRKRRVSMWAVSQLDKSINHNVRDLLEDGWLARPLKNDLILFVAKLKQKCKLSQAKAFFYVRYHDAFGTTDTRKDGTFSSDNKRVRILDPEIAGTYSTEQEVSSPVLDRMRDDARQEYLKTLLKGERVQANCPVCNGHKVVTGCEYPIEKPTQTGYVYEVHFQPMSDEEIDKELVLNVFAKRSERECHYCNAKGYYYPDDHEDYHEAKQLLHRAQKLQGVMK